MSKIAALREREIASKVPESPSGRRPVFAQTNLASRYKYTFGGRRRRDFHSHTGYIVSYVDHIPHTIDTLAGWNEAKKKKSSDSSTVPGGDLIEKNP